jgi:cation diffusion facilitator CzcD-associated flavoprotein CzcO
VEHVDVIIVGAGLSGVGGACHLKTHCPRKSFLILEGRERMGGTWDLFRYPGVRSDSDMYTLGIGSGRGVITSRWLMALRYSVTFGTRRRNTT